MPLQPRDPAHPRLGKATIVALIALGLCLFTVATNAFVIAGVLSAIAGDLGVPPSTVALSVTVYSTCVAIVAPVASLLTTRVPRKTLLCAALAIVVLGTTISALAPTVWFFTLGRLVSAVGGAALVPTATACAAAVVPPSLRARGMAIVIGGFTAASAVGAPLGTALAAASGWRVTMLAIALLGCVCAVAVAFLPARLPSTAPVSLRRRFAALVDARLILVLMAGVASVAGGNALYLFIGEIAGSVGIETSALAVVLTVYGFAGLVGNALGGWLTDKLGSRKVILLLVPLQAAAVAGLVLAGPLWSLVLLVLLWGVTGGGQQPANQHRLVSIDPRTADVALAWNSTALYIGLALAPIGGAAIITGPGLDVLPLAAAVVVLMSGTLLQLSFRSSPRVTSTLKDRAGQSAQSLPE